MVVSILINISEKVQSYSKCSRSVFQKNGIFVVLSICMILPRGSEFCNDFNGSCTVYSLVHSGSPELHIFKATPGRITRHTDISMLDRAVPPMYTEGGYILCLAVASLCTAWQLTTISNFQFGIHQPFTPADYFF